MLNACLEIRGQDVVCSDRADGRASAQRDLSEGTLAKLRGWAERYDRAVLRDDADAIAGIGQDVAAFLNEGDRWLDCVLDGTGEIQFEVVVSANPNERE